MLSNVWTIDAWSFGSTKRKCCRLHCLYSSIVTIKNKVVYFKNTFPWSSSQSSWYTLFQLLGKWFQCSQLSRGYSANPKGHESGIVLKMHLRVSVAPDEFLALCRDMLFSDVVHYAAQVGFNSKTLFWNYIWTFTGKKRLKLTCSAFSILSFCFPLSTKPLEAKRKMRYSCDISSSFTRHIWRNQRVFVLL